MGGWQKQAIAVVLSLLAVMLLAAGYRATLTPVTLTIDGERRTIHTHQPTVEMLLADLGISLRPEDTLSPNLSAALEPNIEVQIAYARPIVIE